MNYLVQVQRQLQYMLEAGLDSQNIRAGSIVADRIKSNTITATQIAAGTITATEIEIGSITGDKLADTTVTGGKIANTTITGGKIATGTITADKIATGELIVGTNVGLGTAQDSAGVTTIIGDTVTTSFINALDIEAATVSADWVYAGDILADQITVGTLTGFTIQTAETGARIVMNNSDFASYDALGNKVLWISPDRTTYGGTAINFGTDETTIQGTIYSNASIFSILGSTDILISSVLDTVSIQGPTRFTFSVDFSSASVTGITLAISDVTGLQTELDSKADNWTGFTGTFNTTTQEIHVSNGIITSINSLP